MNILLERGVEEVIQHEHLEQRLAKGDKLRVKLGIDPTAKDLHLGHTVVLRKLRQFQDAGHQAVLIIGDYTARIGDPSGRNEERPMLTPETITENMKEYLQQAGKVLDLSRLEVRYNSEWYGTQSLMFFLELSRTVTIAQLLKREDFRERLKADQDLSMLETMYPMLQGYDSVAVKADVELGGLDQKLNLLMGRRVQRRYNMPEQDILVVPLLVGLDGVSKMSKSLGNYIGLSDSPDDMYAKVMSIPDTLMPRYYELLTDQIFDPGKPPRAAKAWLAVCIITQYHGPEAAGEAQTEFTRVFSKKEMPDAMPEHKAGELAEVLLASGLVASNNEAHRLLEQNAVKINGKTATDSRFVVQAGDIIKVGARRFLRII